MPKKRNEVTSKRVASIAGRILEALKPHKSTDFVHLGLNGVDYVTVGELKALAASALTQHEPTREEMVKDIENAMKSFMGVLADSEPIRERKTPKRKPARKGRK